VYWAAGGAIMKVGLDGGTPVQLASGQYIPFNIAVNASGVYWLSAGKVMKVGLDGGGAPVELASGFGFAGESPGGIVVDANDVYWTTGVNGDVTKVPVGGGAATMLATGPTAGMAIAVDSQFVYWFGGSGTLWKVALAGGSPVTVASGVGGLYLDVDASSAYFIGGSIAHSMVQKVALGGGTPTTLAPAGIYPWGLAVDADNVYWTTQGDQLTAGTVLRVAREGGNPIQLATGDTPPVGIAVDANCVYWTEQNAVKKAPKCGGSALPDAGSTDQQGSFFFSPDLAMSGG
jgi:hypothetical protein